jgi:HK97 gp10 family phage protein
MSRPVVISTSGFRDLDRALAELPKATGKNVLKRTLMKAAEPIADKARELVPVDRGDLKASISVSARIKNKVGNAEFSAAMRAGLGKAAAVQAMRDARREASGSFAEMFVGPAVPKGFYGHLVEFGTNRAAAQPYMRPAWDATQGVSLDIVKAELGNQIIAAARRIGRSKKQSVDVKYRASIAALLAVEAQG